MSKLTDLKAAETLEDFAKLIGYQPSALSFILYKIPEDQKYKSFQIPKKNGGLRDINAPIPRLKVLQKHLANLLVDCQTEIDAGKNRTKYLAHGFRKDCSIFTNASLHKNCRYVFNIDIENFFPSFNFGRVRGFFIKNSDFALKEKIATIIAQISCHNNELPQGSPSSPIISNIIGHIIDMRLVKLAKKHKCTYSRYADDISVSTNQKSFPKDLAFQLDESSEKWLVGKDIEYEIGRSGFNINHTKTRMQYRPNRQMVTGLVVNKKVNIRSEYYKSARSMCHALFTKGHYYTLGQKNVETGQYEKLEHKNLAVIEGILSHIFYIKDKAGIKSDKRKSDKPVGVRKLYKDFLFFKHFVHSDMPLVICEGKTDIVYIKCAIAKLAEQFPKLYDAKKEGYRFNVRFLHFSGQAYKILQMGGTGPLKSIIQSYKEIMAKFKSPKSNPVIILIDNDDGAQAIFKIVKEKFKKEIEIKSNDLFYHLHDNLYLIKTPVGPGNGYSYIEHLFDPKLLAAELNGKKLSLKKEHQNHEEYSKAYFAEYVIKKNWKEIDFSKFSILLKGVVSVVENYQNLDGYK